LAERNLETPISVEDKIGGTESDKSKRKAVSNGAVFRFFKERRIGIAIIVGFQAHNYPSRKS